MKTFDVAIIGGGITGFSTAYFLKKCGLKNVAIFEREYPGAGSTGRCGTGIRQQFTTKEHVVLMRESVKLWQEWEFSLPYPIHFRQGGYLWLLSNDDEYRLYADYVKFQNILGVPSRIISREEAKEIVPFLNTSSFLGASYCPTDGNAYPQDVINSLKFEIENAGYKILNEEVTGFKIENNLIYEIVTNKNRYSTGFVVNAAGNNAKKLASFANIELPVENYRHQILVSEPMEIFLSPMIVKGDLYFTQTYRGRIIGGTDTHEPAIESLDTTIKFLEKFAKEVTDVIPILSSIKVMRIWAGFYVTSPDKHPILGPTEISNFILGCGYSGHGFMLGPIVGKLLSSFIVNGNFFLEEANRLTLRRFKTGELIHEKAVIG